MIAENSMIMIACVQEKTGLIEGNTDLELETEIGGYNNVLQLSGSSSGIFSASGEFLHLLG